MSADRCPTCDRDGCDGARLLAEHRRAMAGGDHDAANVTLTEWAALGCRPVDWRAKFFAAESDAAKDRDAAKWRKVEPLIKRLCAFEDGPTDLRDLLTVALDVLAATKEPS